MYKRIISIILVVVFILSFTSCDYSKDLIKENPQDTIIGFVTDSVSELAAKSYAGDGAQLIGYNNLSDLLLAIENGYVNYGVLSDYEFVQASNAERKIEVYEECPFKIDFCAYFRNDSTELRDSFNDSLENMKSKGIIDKIKEAEYNGITYYSSYTGNGETELKVLCNPAADFYFYMLEDGVYSGIDVKILETFAEENGYNISYISDFDDDELFLKLKNGEGDILISDYSYNSKRAEQYLVSDVYFTVKFNLVIRKSIWNNALF